MSFDDREIALASVYAAALLTLAKERKEEKDVGEELEQMADALEKLPFFPSFLTSPTVNLKRRRDTLEKMFRGRASQTFVDALLVLNRNGRLGLLHAISEQYKTLYRESQNRVKAIVQSAAPLGEAHLTRLRDELKRRTGKDVEFESKVREDLLGGMILQVGDKKIDASISRKLEKMSEAILDRWSRELLRAAEYVA
ncbi:MAG: ATP synthase F1 subunit delta [Planctomycetes bacterium]|nr:ATP synthase F1 subunit delta [Planctomycetota bacterium]MBI3833017.1 ATP synthase F1 subunit delta [Planctomycetota bacterium]